MKNPSSFLALMLCANVAFAEPPAAPTNETESAASELVDKQLLAPMRKSESRRKSFSRAMPVPVARRVRVLDSEALTDARGRKFVRFAIDVRRGLDEEGAWHKDSMRGCAYPSESEVYVQDGGKYLTARALLGAGGKARTDVCRAATLAAAAPAKPAS